MKYTYVVFVICAVLSADLVSALPCRKFVGFSVSLDANTAFEVGKTIVYKNILTNIGNHYDPKTGVFTAPTTGYYLFQIHAATLGPPRIWLQLLQNEVSRATIYAKESSYVTMAGNGVLLDVKAGDRIYVKAVYAASNVQGDLTNHYTTFSGHLAGL